MTFRKFDLDMLAAQGLGTRPFKEGEKIFTNGDPGDCMYVVESGVVNIVNYGAVLDNIKAGDIFGEMSLIDGSPRSANAVAAEQTKVIAIDQDAFLKLVAHDPKFSLQVMRRLAERLRDMNESV